MKPLTVAVELLVLDAGAISVQFVSTTLAGIPEMVVDGTTGALVPERQPALLADKIRLFLKDRSLAAVQGAAGLERCKELFAIKRTSASLLEILNSHGAISS